MSVLPDEQYPQTLMSNFEHTINADVADALKENPTMYAQYSGWDFCGYVFWNEPQWTCEVWVYHEPREIISADSLEAIMEQVSGKYGEE